MKIAVFWGCRILTGQYAYEMSTRETFTQLGIELADLKEANCCGDPVKSLNRFAALYLASRTLALSNQTGLTDLLVPCSRCHFSLSETEHLLKRDAETREKIEKLLKEENLEFNPNLKIWHVIDLLHDKLGLENIKTAVKKPLNGLKLATHSGCQTLRPSDIGRPENSENPRKLDALVEVLGAETLSYAEKLDCCGYALTFSRPDAALSLAGTKLKAVQELGAQGLVTACPDCHLMFDAKQRNAATTVGAKIELPVVYYTQLLGLAMQIPKEKLGLHLNQTPVEKLFAT